MRKVSHAMIGLLILLVSASAQPGVTASRVTASMFASAFIPQGRNTIYGVVYGESHRGVPDIYVELLDDVNSSLGQAKTDALGRFTFSSLVDGRYIVRVKPYGTDYMEQSQEVTLSSIASVRGSGSTTEHLDIYLVINERLRAGPFSAGPSVIFAQEVPPAAKKLYEEGISQLREKKEKEGLESLKKSIEVFPNYYLALDRLGAEYATRGTKNPAYLQAGFALLTRAVEINPNGFSSVFGLGCTQYQLGLNAESIETLKRAASLYGRAADVYLWLGKALRRASTFDQAEVAFKRANELTNGKSSEVHWQLAELYNGQKRYKEAADQLELYLKTEQPKAADAEKIKSLIKQLREKPGGN